MPLPPDRPHAIDPSFNPLFSPYLACTERCRAPRAARDLRFISEPVTPMHRNLAQSLGAGVLVRPIGLEPAPLRRRARFAVSLISLSLPFERRTARGRSWTAPRGPHRTAVSHARCRARRRGETASPAISRSASSPLKSAEPIVAAALTSIPARRPSSASSTRSTSLPAWVRK